MRRSKIKHAAHDMEKLINDKKLSTKQNFKRLRKIFAKHYIKKKWNSH